MNKNKRMIWLLVLKKEKIKALVLKRLKEKGGLKFKRMIKGVYQAKTLKEEKEKLGLQF